ncbi:hypothetical protein [Kitasatospora sp. NPDC058046]|uniref:hypothetical protein n=1 Tax=Kitasatospora sp. NPDC058046 TaxID=3346312 RepID=UPI0036DA4739
MSKKLAAALKREDDQEDTGAIHGDDRTTCHKHQGWAKDCEDRHRPLIADQLLTEGSI